MYALTWLADTLRASGLNVEEVVGWKDRGHGAMAELKGVLCHHTAGALHGDAPSLPVVTNGRIDLPGPLAQLFLARSGTWHVVAAGLAYHAGAGDWPGVGHNAGNEHLIGIEAENTGLGEPWSPIIMHSYARGCAALLKHIGAPVAMCLGHKEYAPGRKTDPSFDMVAFRQDVAVQMHS